MKKTKAQGMLDYAMLIVVIMAAMMIAHKYITRSMNAKLKQIQEQLEYKK
jgi:hypothetical protein